MFSLARLENFLDCSSDTTLSLSAVFTKSCFFFLFSTLCIRHGPIELDSIDSKQSPRGALRRSIGNAPEHLAIVLQQSLPVQEVDALVNKIVQAELVVSQTYALVDATIHRPSDEHEGAGLQARKGSKSKQHEGEGWTNMRERVYRPGRGPRQHNGVGFGVSQAARTAKSQEGWTDMRERVYRPGRGPRQHKGVGFGVSQAARTAKISGEHWGTAMVVEVAICVHGVSPLPMGMDGWMVTWPPGIPVSYPPEPHMRITRAVSPGPLGTCCLIR
ncbi:hypothetical protein THAOC_16100 [Thalassiosira oceanica]|uniref:Uncharacterized protein n=1 Tax=Thalassiosira oceanica TaxID=159749 RepID=K0SYI1_THAOC|nr:hypothetical protein THAOC_16100 [Thalassiosira oceanica]|eukprot:EJK63257.1 hypothetical protein THAOC_16100 [Thalassiosira oceanica]